MPRLNDDTLHIRLQRLYQAGLRPTLQRLSVLGVLETLGQDSFSVEQLFQTLRQHQQPISLTTVYRVLHDFETAGFLTRQWMDGNRASYLYHPWHMPRLILRLVCRCCGRQELVDDPELLERLRQQAAHLGMETTGATLYGQCRHCNAATKEEVLKRA
ncbi:Fur family transcriptional regulator [Azovibrio restrictus]|uniref:Fur family transcriptional regulator n=1 Tax=Azovibrio restrictus TaxID=146938 RepID=UPI0026F0495E|nr:transcriptional repressor [Azovibrio restrictus]MDD3483974.1 transcriptional repressor [Azovibrio restrictus]